MSDETRGSAPAPLPLPENPSIEWLREQAKRRLDELPQPNPAAQLADAQFDLAKQDGFSATWRSCGGWPTRAVTSSGTATTTSWTSSVGRRAVTAVMTPRIVRSWMCS